MKIYKNHNRIIIQIEKNCKIYKNLLFFINTIRLELTAKNRYYHQINTICQILFVILRRFIKIQMTGTELQQLLDAHCQDMRADMPGFLFYGILSCTDGTILSKASANESTSKIIEEGSAFHLTIVNQVKQVLATNHSIKGLELDYILIETNKITFMLMISALGKFFSITALERDKANVGISRALLYKCKAEFSTMLDDFF